MLIYNREDLSIVDVNPSALALYGYTKEEFLKLTIRDLRPVSEFEKLEQELDKQEKGFNDAGIVSHLRKDGTPIHVRILSSPVKNGDSNLRLVLAQNVTEYVDAKERLENEKEMLTAVTQNLPGTFYVINQEGKILRWNKNLETITGYSSQEIAKSSALIYFDPKDHPRIKKAIAEGFRTGKAELKTNLITKNGDRIPFYFSASTSTLYGEPYLIGLGIDISKQHKAQEQLLQQKMLLDAITQQSESIIFVKDVDGPYKLVNEKFKQDLGFTGQKVIGNTDRNLFETELAKQLIKDDTQVLESGTAKRFEEIIPTVDGSKTYYTVKYPLLDIPGYENSICGIATDITELKEAESKLEELYEKEKREREQLQLINSRLQFLSRINTIFLDAGNTAVETLEKVADVIVEEIADLCSFDLLIDDQLQRVVTRHRDKKKEEIARRIHETNPDMFYSSSFLSEVLSAKKQVFIPEISDQLIDEYLTQPELADQVEALEIESVLIKPLLVQDREIGTMTLLLSGEQTEWVEDASILLDELAYKIALATDHLLVNEELAKLNETLEKKVEQRTEMLEKANKELESFSYSVSHDLRAPLRAIDGYSSLLLEDYYDELDEDGKEFLNIVNEETKRMGELIDDLLSFSRMSRLNKSAARFSMNDLVNECVEEVTASFPDTDPVVEVEELPEVEADSRLLKQVWLNLLNNSFKYCEPGKDPKIYIRSELNEEKQVYIFSIEDKGVGFDMKYADKLFGVFQRLHSDDEFEGTGIGLALVRRIINRHHGKTWADSTPGKGTIIYFSLPVNPHKISQ
ncbi:PAS domain-containing sensor histidine kinase [Gracilimonas sp.]|uniref:PAS domain-containing sensor histidine kinase n=1 Tax=Gracilimonas sp. TaxID=1974203 RepID=UPI003D0F9E44